MTGEYGEENRVDRRSVLRLVGVGLGLSGLRGRSAVDSDSGERRSGAAEGEAAEPGAARPAEPGAARPAALGAARNRFYAGRAVAGEGECYRPGQREIYGPTDITAQSANGRLAIGLNDQGTVTVFRWPRPSYYDQLKYFTRGRTDDDGIDVAPNHGAFLGLAIESGGGFETSWLREWPVTQRYADDLNGPAFTDEVVTTYTSDEYDLRVVVSDLVVHRENSDDQRDAFVRRVRVVREGDPDDQPAVKLLAYENCNLVVSKRPQFPVRDWCTEEANVDRARYNADRDAIVHAKTGLESSTGAVQSVAVAMGFAGKSDGHQVGGDAYDPTVGPAGQTGPARDAYDDASSGSLSGNDAYVGQTTGALATELTFVGPVATERVVFAAAHAPESACAYLDRIRDRPYRDLRAEKHDWLADVLADAPLPDTGDETVLAVCRRALVTLVTDYDPDTGAVVASIATQAPYAEDWIRDGAYFNYVLDLVGRHDWVRTREEWYAEIQQRAGDPRLSHPDTPPGNWAMNYYGDGVAGGPIPYEIDETGYGIWTLWDHYTVTGDTDYLERVYPAIRRAGDYLLACRDPRTGLPCVAPEDDRFVPSQTIVGAAPVWMGLEAAHLAARELEDATGPGTGSGPGTVSGAGTGSGPGPETVTYGADATRYEARQHELGRAIDRHLYDPEHGAYGLTDDGIGFAPGEVVWPVCFRPYADPETGAIRERPTVDSPFEHPRIREHLDTVWAGVAPSFEAPHGRRETGQYEVKGLLSLAKARRPRRRPAPGSLGDVERGLAWVVQEHAETDTHVMGEAWKVFAGAAEGKEVRSIVSQPHAWEQVLTYLAALETWPPIAEFEERSCGSVLAELRKQTSAE